MKRTLGMMICLLVLATPAALAQSKSLASTMEVYVFPSEGQDSSQQSKDEAECYNWAVGQTGSDPFELQKQAQQVEQQSAAAQQEIDQAGKGAGAKGAVGGAAAGALVGEIVSDDAGKGAAYGAAAGAIAGRRRSRKAKSEASSQVEQQTQATTGSIEEQMTNFKKAFSVCLESKSYMVKY